MDDNPYRSPATAGSSNTKFDFPAVARILVAAGISIVGWMLLGGAFFAIYFGGGIGVPVAAIMGLFAAWTFYAVSRIDSWSLGTLATCTTFAPPPARLTEWTHPRSGGSGSGSGAYYVLSPWRRRVAVWQHDGPIPCLFAKACQGRPCGGIVAGRQRGIRCDGKVLRIGKAGPTTPKWKGRTPIALMLSLSTAESSGRC